MPAIDQEAQIFDRLLVSGDSAKAVLAVRFAPQDEERMRELLDKNNQGNLSAEEQAEMEAFRRVGSFLAILQAKARLLLQQGDGSQHSAA